MMVGNKAILCNKLKIECISIYLIKCNFRYYNNNNISSKIPQVEFEDNRDVVFERSSYKKYQAQK